MRTPLLQRLYEEFDIDNLPLQQHGKTSDALGKLYEKYIIEIFKNMDSISTLHSNEYPQEKDIIQKFLDIKNITFTDISNISSSDHDLGRTIAGGSPKTDVVITLTLHGQPPLCIPLNIKASSQKKVSIAEYDAETICTSVGIPDGELKNLILKHQNDQSAKNFTFLQKQRLTELLKPYRREFIRWCITLSSQPSQENILYPDLLIRFKVINREFVSVEMCDIETYIDTKIAAAEKRNSGFGTGLSWTYASGSGSKKMQFKG